MVTAMGTISAVAQLVQHRIATQSRARVHPEKATLVPVSTACASACGPSVIGKGLTGFDAPFFAVRGNTAAGICTRGAKVVVKNGGLTPRGPYRIKRNKALWFKYSQKMRGLPKTQMKKAREAVMHDLKRQYRNRRLLKRDMRTLWIQRVNSNCKLHGVRYSQFIQHLYLNDVVINRKIMSQLGIYDRPVFTNIMNLAIPSWSKQLDRKMNPPIPKFMDKTEEELEDVVLTHIERKFPDIYENPNIRFNRREEGDTVQYTIDVGDPEEWRKLLPKSPELANFNLPDHFIRDANRQREVQKQFEVWTIRNEDPEDEEYVAAQKEYQKKLEKEQATAEQGIPIPSKKEGESRDDWFNDEPQSWY
jgi:large subunit ribosomal protein L20